MPAQGELSVLHSQLTPSEVLLLRACRDLQVQLKNEEITFDHIVGFLNSAKSIETVLKLVNVYIPLEEWCGAEKMEDYWGRCWAKLGRSPTWKNAQKDSQLIYRSLVPQPKIKSFELVRGMWFYKRTNCLALNNPNHADVRPLLDKAVQVQCFDAVRERLPGAEYQAAALRRD